MTIHSAADYGYSNRPEPRRVHVGDTFRLKCALGIREMRVVRRHRDLGYWETVMTRWITEVEPFRQGFVGGLQVMSDLDILRAKYAD